MCRRSNNSETYTVIQVAKALGMSAESVRAWMSAPSNIRPEWATVKKGKRNKYIISKPLFIKEHGIIIKEENK